MPAWCLIQSKANDFLKAIQKGELDPLKIADLSSIERRELLSKYVGEDNARNVNSLYESKLLLKDQQQGIINWIKKTGNLTKETRRDLISKIQRLDNVLSPADEKGFLADLASSKLGADVTAKEATNIFNLSQKVKETESLRDEDNIFPTNNQRMAYGRSKVALANYVAELKAKGESNFTLNPIKILKAAPGVSKSIQASLDDSAIFRQGWRTLFTHPATWLKNASRTFGDMIKEFGTKKVMDEINADLMSRPNYDRYMKAKLAVTKPEDIYASSLPEKIPILGRAYKATETAYTGFVYRQRADIFDKYLQIADKSGLDINDTKTIQPIASMVNSLTGRGNFGKYEQAAGLLNNVFFSARNIKSQIDALGHVITGAGGSGFVRKEAAINLVKVITGIAGIITVANALKPGSAETDPRSADFGKIRVKDTRFDITGGMASLVTLASRLATMSSKSSTTGNVNPINSGKFGSQTGKDVVVDWLTNKLSPAGALIVDLLNQKDFDGNPITAGGELKKSFTPLSFANYEELKKNSNSADILLTMIADGLGIGTNTYSQKAKTAKTVKAKPTQQSKKSSGGLKLK